MLETRRSSNWVIRLLQSIWYDSYLYKLWAWKQHKKTMKWLKNEYEVNPEFAKAMMDLGNATGVTAKEAADSLSKCMMTFGIDVDCDNNKHPLEK